MHDYDTRHIDARHADLPDGIGLGPEDDPSTCPECEFTNDHAADCPNRKGM